MVCKTVGGGNGGPWYVYKDVIKQPISYQLRYYVFETV